MAQIQKNRNMELYRLRKKKGWAFRKIADHFSISVVRARQIYKSEEQRPQWPRLRRMLSVRAQNAILSRFACDESIFNDPERIITETDARDLWRYKNVGKVTIIEIVAALVAMGYHLRPQWHLFTLN